MSTTNERIPEDVLLDVLLGIRTLRTSRKTATVTGI